MVNTKTWIQKNPGFFVSRRDEVLSLLETLATVDNPGMCNKPLKNFVVNKKETEYNTFVKLCFVT